MPPISPPSGSSPGDVAAVRRRRLLGVGVRADLVGPGDLGRDVSLVRTGTGVDLALVDGVDALAQDLAVGLTTLRGSDPVNVGFGFLGLTALTQDTSPVLAREGIRSAVAQLVAADPRVRRITDLTVTTPADPASRQLGITVSFEAISGEVTTLQAGATASTEVTA